MEEQIRTEESKAEESVAEGNRAAEEKQAVPNKVGRKKRGLRTSRVAKIFAFILLVVSSFTAATSIMGVGIMVDEGFYSAVSFEDAFMSLVNSRLLDDAQEVRGLLWLGTDREELEYYLSKRNIDVEVYDEDGALRWGTYDGYETSMILDVNLTLKEGVVLGDNPLADGGVYLFRIYVDPAFSKHDMLYSVYRDARYLYHMQDAALWLALASCVVVLTVFLFLLCSAGCRRRWKEGEGEKIFRKPLDVLTVVFVLGLGGGFFLVKWVGKPYYLFQGYPVISEMALAVGVPVTVCVVWVTIYLYEVVAQVRLGKWWRHTLVYIVLRAVLRLLGHVVRFLGRALGSIPLVVNTFFFYIVLCFLEALGVFNFMMSNGVVLWAIEKVLLLPVVLYVALTCKKLLKASEALAEGKQDYVVDTSLMFGDFKKHGENLNSLGYGIARAVEERMRSERLKTELITNVSHDLKTPLTSIINYSSLICGEETENGHIKEYSQVLHRQSERLKKLLEDLVEASKATTGNLEVTLSPCQVGVLLSQAVGEYQQKMDEKSLELRAVQPEEPVQIMADGRHLWRVFDNLLNNICKYAQEGSRVYLSVEVSDGEVRILFRNMSKYALNIAPEELEERFVRGDKSRNMEGNGLGLSIAKSLTELQNGRMSIVIDGDLFKVTLSFRELQA